MKKELENWKSFLLQEKCWDGYKQVGMKDKGGKMVPNCVPDDGVNEEVKDKYGTEVEDRSKKSRDKGIAAMKLAEDEQSLLPKVVKALRAEGGAAGMDALKKHTGASKSEIDSVVNSADNIKVHKDGDYILMDSLNEEEDEVKKDACYHKVKANSKKWPSAYASGRLVQCRDKGADNWNVDESIQEKKQASKEKHLGDWFDRKGEKGSKGGWVDCNAPDGDGGYKECAQGDRKEKPYCRPTPSACKEEPKKESIEMRISKQRLNEIIKETIEESIYYHIADATYDDGTLAEDIEFWDDVLEEAEYQGRKVTLNKPMKGDVKKSKVYVKNEKGNVVKVNFGDPNMKIRKSNPEARKSFRARHKCDQKKPKTSPGYWSCKAW